MATNRYGLPCSDNNIKNHLSEKLFIEIPHDLKFAFATILLLIRVAIFLNKKSHRRITSLFQLAWELDASFAETLCEGLNREYVCSWVMFFFLKKLFGLSDEQLLEFLSYDRKWASAIGFNPEHKSKSRVSEARKKIGQKNINKALEILIAQAFDLVGVGRVSEKAILEYSAAATILKSKSYINKTGFAIFFQFLTNFGIIAELIGCSHKDDSNSQYNKQDILYVLIRKLVLNAKTITELSKEHRNDIHRSGEIIITPNRITLSDEIKSFDADKLNELSIRLIKRIRTLQGLTKTLIGIDSTILEVYGKHEEAAEVVDHSKNRKVKAYKLFIALDLRHKQIVAFKLTSGKANDATQLLDMMKLIIENIGQNNVDIVTFDKGFYKAESFGKINRKKIDYITPAKKYDNVKQAIETITNYKPYQEGAEIADRWISLKGYGNIRIIIIRKTVIKYYEVKNAKGTRYLLDRNGERIKLPYEETIYHPYFTNIPQRRMTAPEIIEFYSKRWNIENFFDELKAQWWIKYFPSTDINTIKSYTYFILILYQALGFFKILFFNGRYKRCQLVTIRTEFLNVAVELFKSNLFGYQLSLHLPTESQESRNNPLKKERLEGKISTQLAEEMRFTIAA